MVFAMDLLILYDTVTETCMASGFTIQAGGDENLSIPFFASKL